MISAHLLAANRRDERAASRARVEIRAQLERHRQAERRARDVLRDAILATGIPAAHGVAILAAADSLRKAAVIAALAEGIDSEPADGGAS